MPRSAFTRLLAVTAAACLSVLATGCATSGGDQPALEPVAAMDLESFMGDWYVIAALPNRIEDKAFNSLETYRLRDDGKIDVGFAYNKGSLDGKRKTMTQVGTVLDGRNTVWTVRPFWPIDAAYVIIDLADDYRYTVIGHPSRRYAWIMARDTTMPENDWQAAVGLLESQGFPVDQLRKVPHDSAS